MSKTNDNLEMIVLKWNLRNDNPNGTLENYMA